MIRISQFSVGVMVLILCYIVYMNTFETGEHWNVLLFYHQTAKTSPLHAKS